MDVKKVLESKEYSFLKENSHLGKNIGMLCLGGSLAYGTNIEGKGDIDIRGIAFETSKEIIGLTPSFEQVVETNTDTTIYAFNKIIKLLMENNPNTIEMLGCKKEHYFYMTDTMQNIIDNRKMFLSKRCIYSFGGYADQQLARLENALARDRLPQAKKEEHILNSLNNAMRSFSQRYNHFEMGSINLYTDDSKKPNFDKETFANISLTHFPVREFNSILNELVSIVRQYDKLNGRNRKKDEEHLNKHAMHLIRLYLMAIDLLEKEEIVTYREFDRPMLLDIRLGKYMNPDGSYNSAFYDYLNILKNRFEYAKENTSLPEKPNTKAIEEIVMDVNMKIVEGRPF